MELLELFNQYARSELMVLVPVLFFFNKIIYQSKINNAYIPMICTVFSVAMSLFHTVSIAPVNSLPTFMLALFTSFTQGILYAGASMFAGVLLNPGSVKPQDPRLPEDPPK